MSILPDSSFELSPALQSAAASHTLHDEIGNLIEKNGYAYVHGAPNGFDYANLLAKFGDFIPQYDGALVWDLIPEPDMDDLYHSKNTQPLVPHTEAYEFPGNPPRYVALWCIKKAAGSGGETTLLDGRRLLDEFSESQLDEFRTRSYTWHSTEGLTMKGITVESVHPILDSDKDRLIIRYSYNNVKTTGDGILERYLDIGKRLFDAEHKTIAIEEGCLLVWDNWRMLHSRNGFTDRSRHLKRILVS